MIESQILFAMGIWFIVASAEPIPFADRPADKYGRAGLVIANALANALFALAGFGFIWWSIR